MFGVIEEACMPANIRDDAFIEQLARSIHADYVAKSEARGETEAENKSMVPWDKLPKDLRRCQHRPGGGHRRQAGGHQRRRRP